MRFRLLVAVLVTCSFVASRAQCPKDQDERINKEMGLLIFDFIITGTQALTSEELATIRSKLVGWCINEDRDEVEGRVRDIFQNNGYFGVVVGAVTIRVNDPIARPKTVTVEAEVKEGSRYHLGEITFTNNRAFTSSTLRATFPSKKGDLFERSKIGGGLEALRKLYVAEGHIDFTAIPDTEFSADQINLAIDVDEGPQYRMGRLEIFAKKELVEKLKGEWQLPDGVIFDGSYVERFLNENKSTLPPDFTQQNVQVVRNCPESLATVRFFIDLSLVPQSLPQRVACKASSESGADRASPAQLTSVERMGARSRGRTSTRLVENRR
jgi:outer membrane protein assembly factor BamA